MNLQTSKTIEETPPPPSPIGRLPIEGEVYREGGMWKIRLIVPEWIMHDIEQDVQGSTLVGIIINPPSTYPGTSYRIYTSQPPWYMFGMVRFEWNVEK